jgi:hypothetical protein
MCKLTNELNGGGDKKRHLMPRLKPETVTSKLSADLAPGETSDPNLHPTLGYHHRNSCNQLEESSNTTKKISLLPEFNATHPRETW